MDKIGEMLAGLRKERERLTGELAEVDRAIAALEGRGTVSLQGGDQRIGPYTGLTLFEAAAVYLAGAGEPKTTREIARALLEGGFVTRAKYFTGIVATMLTRQESAQASGIRRTKNKKRWFVNR